MYAWNEVASSSGSSCVVGSDPCALRLPFCVLYTVVISVYAGMLWVTLKNSYLLDCRSLGPSILLYTLYKLSSVLENKLS